MERVGFTMRILPGQRPSIAAGTRPSGRRCSTRSGRRVSGLLDFILGDRLFAYLEVDDFAAFRASMAAAPVNDRWQAEMAALIDPMTDPTTGFHQRLEEDVSTSTDGPNGYKVYRRVLPVKLSRRSSASGRSFRPKPSRKWLPPWSNADPGSSSTPSAWTRSAAQSSIRDARDGQPREPDRAGPRPDPLEPVGPVSKKASRRSRFAALRHAARPGEDAVAARSAMIARTPPPAPIRADCRVGSL